jgi:predicted nucleotidyltransferase component of viral defense system
LEHRPTPLANGFISRIFASIVNRYYYGFRIIMSINKSTPSPLALREGFHVVLLRALAERLQGRDWVLKGGTNLRLYFGSIRFSEDIDLDVGKDVAGAMQRAIPATLADGDVQRRLQALGILQASLIGGRSSKSTDTTLRYKIELVGRGGIRPPTKIDVSYRDRCEGDEHAVSPANDSAVREYLRPDDPPLLLPSYTRSAAIRQKINALASRTHVQARDVFDLFVLGGGTLRNIDTGFLRRWLDDATLRNARGRALEISHAEYSDTVLAYLDPAQREQLQDEDTWLERQLFVGDLINQILTVPRETIP